MPSSHNPADTAEGIGRPDLTLQGSLNNNACILRVLHAFASTYCITACYKLIRMKRSRRQEQKLGLGYRLIR